MVQFITPYEAARLVDDDMTLAVSGHAGFGTPDGLFKASRIGMLKKAARRI